MSFGFVLLWFEFEFAVLSTIDYSTVKCRTIFFTILMFKVAYVSHLNGVSDQNEGCRMPKAADPTAT